MRLEDQLQHFDRRARWVLALSLSRLMDPDYQDKVIARARERLIEGHPIYDDLMYTWSREKLLDEALEEHADGLVNYPLALDWRVEKQEERPEFFVLPAMPEYQPLRAWGATLPSGDLPDRCTP